MRMMGRLDFQWVSKLFSTITTIPRTSLAHISIFTFIFYLIFFLIFFLNLTVSNKYVYRNDISQYNIFRNVIHRSKNSYLETNISLTLYFVLGERHDKRKKGERKYK
ncbi:hypothetical protein AAZV13_11G097800 [Glycine max]